MSELSLKRRRSGAISGSERITGVKNAQADMLLSRKKLHYDVLLKKTEQVSYIDLSINLSLSYWFDVYR